MARARKKEIAEVVRPGTGEARKHRQKLRDLTDSQVVQASLDGDSRAFGELVRRYDGRLLNFVYRTIGDRERGQDLVQETFVRVYRHLHRFDQSKKFSTWIYTIASNLAKNELRNRSRNPLVLFQTIMKNWDADHRPLEWEDTQYKPDDPLPQAASPDQGRAGREAVAGAPQDRLRATRDGRQDVRGDRGDHELQPRNGEESVESGAQQLCADHRPDDRLTT